MNNITNHPLLTPQQVADKVNLGKSTIYRLAKEEKIDCIRFGRSVRFILEDVERFILENKIGGSYDELDNGP